VTYRRVQKGGDIPLAGLHCPSSSTLVVATSMTSRPRHEYTSTLPTSSTATITSQPPASSHPPATTLSRSSSSSSSCSSDTALGHVTSLHSPLDVSSSSHYSMVSTGRPAATSRRVRDEVNAAKKLELELVLAEERRKRQEQDERINRSRRHSAFMTLPTAPVALDRYMDDTDIRLSTRTTPTTAASGVTTVRSKAKAIYNFQAQSHRELTLRRGDIVYLLRAVNENWFEGEHHGLVGIFPINYVQVLVSFEEAAAANAHRHVTSGSVVEAVYDFERRTSAELSLCKGDVVTVLRQLDENWCEGQIDDRQGLFPINFTNVLTTALPAVQQTEQMTANIDQQADVTYSSSLTSSRPVVVSTSQPATDNFTSGHLHRSHHHQQQQMNKPLLTLPSFEHHGNSCPYSPSSRSSPRSRGSQQERIRYSRSTERDRRSRTSREGPEPRDRREDADRGVLEVTTDGGWSGRRMSMDETILHQPTARCRRRRPHAQQLITTSLPEGQSLSIVESSRSVGVTQGHRQEQMYNGGRQVEPTEWRPLPRLPVADQSSLPSTTPAVVNSSSCPSSSVRLGRGNSVGRRGVISYTPYYVTHAFSAQREDELTLNEDDIVYVTEKFDDGWLVGISPRTNDIGSFPAACVRQLVSHSCS
jgi:sorbin and SH3 domain-containing protein 1